MHQPRAKSPQRIARLTPLAAVEAMLDRLAQPVAARALDCDLALGRVLAADLAASPMAGRRLAARDGFAVRADLVAEASAYAPVPIAAAWIEAGGGLPDDTDAVLATDAIVATAAGDAAIAAVSPGEGVLTMLAGGPQEPVRRSGDVLRAIDVAALRALGVARVEVREPLVYVVAANRDVTAAADTVGPLLAAAIEAGGGRAHIMRAASATHALEDALHDGGADAVVTIGGTGEGRGDRTVATVAAHGALALHGVGIRPGETAALATVGHRPVLMLPGRLDAALAIWLVLGRRLLARLTGATAGDRAHTAPLARKITSTVGLADMVLVRRHGEQIEPLPAGLAPQAAARADGWVLVPPESEGYPAGAIVEMRPLP